MVGQFHQAGITFHLIVDLIGESLTPGSLQLCKQLKQGISPIRRDRIPEARGRRQLGDSGKYLSMLQNPSKYHANPLSHFLALHNTQASGGGSGVGGLASLGGGIPAHGQPHHHHALAAAAAAAAVVSAGQSSYQMEHQQQQQQQRRPSTAAAATTTRQRDHQKQQQQQQHLLPWLSWSAENRDAAALDCVNSNSNRRQQQQQRATATAADSNSNSITTTATTTSESLKHSGEADSNSNNNNNNNNNYHPT